MKLSPADFLLVVGLLLFGGSLIAMICHYAHEDYQLWKMRRMK